MKPAVCNASPLIVLARAGYLDLLPRLVSPVAVPQAVIVELNAGPADDAAVRLLGTARWLQVVEVTRRSPPLAELRLGRGETEVLEYARDHPGTVAVLDDKAARRAALALKLPLTGTLGLLLAAVEGGLLPSLAESIDAVRRSGLYVDPATIAALTKHAR